MPAFAYSGRTRDGQTVTGERVADTKEAVVAALRRDQILVTRDQGEGARRPPRRRPPRAAAVPSKNLAIFTRQFSVMIDAGLPLVQCLEILGKQEPHKSFSAVILQDARGRRSRRRPRRRDEEAPQGLRRPLLEHDRGRRGGRYPRHHPEAPGHLHREGGQAEGRSQVGDDLPDRRHRHRRRSSSPPSCGRSSRPSRQLFAGLGAAAAAADARSSSPRATCSSPTAGS